MTFSVAPDTRCLLGESPCWDDARRCLFWCDIAGRQVLARDADGHVRRWPVHAEPGCLALTDAGWLLVAVRDGLYRFEPEASAWTLLVPAPYEPDRERFNDGRCDTAGRFWVGTMYEPRDRSAAGLYRLEVGDGGPWRLVREAGEVVTANGLAFTADGRHAFWADTRGHRIDRFALEPQSGRLLARTPWAHFASQPQPPSPGYGGRPDGASLDVEGGYWVAMYEGGRIVRLDADGRETLSLPVPVRCPTMVGFGGPGMATLFVTSAREGRPADELGRMPDSGSLLCMPAPVAGQPVTRVRTGAG